VGLCIQLEISAKETHQYNCQPPVFLRNKSNDVCDVLYLIIIVRNYSVANPAPPSPGYILGAFVGICRGSYQLYSPSRWGIVIFRITNPQLPPPQPVPAVVGHYIDRCIIVCYCHTSSKIIGRFQLSSNLSATSSL